MAGFMPCAYCGSMFVTARGRGRWPPCGRGERGRAPGRVVTMPSIPLHTLPLAGIAGRCTRRPLAMQSGVAEVRGRDAVIGLHVLLHEIGPLERDHPEPVEVLRPRRRVVVGAVVGDGAERLLVDRQLVGRCPAARPVCMSAMTWSSRLTPRRTAGRRRRCRTRRPRHCGRWRRRACFLAIVLLTLPAGTARGTACRSRPEVMPSL